MPVNFAALPGWVYDPPAVEKVMQSLPMPVFQSAAPQLFADPLPAQVLLYLALKEANGGSHVPYVAQAIGDCVSFGFAHGVDLLSAIQIIVHKKAETLEHACSEAIYGTARVDVGGRSLRGDGAVGAWAAKAVVQLGTVGRTVAGPYSGTRAKAWGANGVPADVKALLHLHQVKATSLVSTGAECKAALAHGYPVPVCSNQGFASRRDAQGFCAPQGSLAHCMLICGYRTDRPGYCIFQSWGQNNPSGPLALDQPPNSFWADANVVENYMLAARDSWSLSAFEGYPRTDLPAEWTYSGFS